MAMNVAETSPSAQGGEKKTRRARTLVLVVLCIGVLGGVWGSGPWVAKALVSAGNRFFGYEGRYDLARADGLFTAALLIDSDVPDAWHQRARIDFLRGEFDSALEKINKQISIHGDSFMASYYIRGLIHGYRKEFVEAERDFLHFLTWDPDNWAARNDLAWVYFAQGKFEETEAEAVRGLTIAPTNPWLLVMHGMARFNLGDFVGAKEDLEKAEREAAFLTEADWRYAYPGNDPAVAGKGVEAFRRAIKENLERVNRSVSIDEEGV